MVMSRVAISTAVLAAMLGFAVSAYAASPLAYCRADAERLCPGVRPGGGAIKNCLKEHENEVSIGCAKEIKKLKAEMGK
jgi:hypothetical protein